MPEPVDTSPRPRPDRPTLDHMGDDDILSIDQAAALLGCSSDDAYQLVRAGELLGIKIPDRGWFVHRDQVDEYIARRG